MCVHKMRVDRLNVQGETQRQRKKQQQLGKSKLHLTNTIDERKMRVSFAHCSMHIVTGPESGCDFCVCRLRKRSRIQPDDDDGTM